MKSFTILLQDYDTIPGDTMDVKAILRNTFVSTIRTKTKYIKHMNINDTTTIAMSNGIYLFYSYISMKIKRNKVGEKRSRKNKYKICIKFKRMYHQIHCSESRQVSHVYTNVSTYKQRRF